MRIFETRKEKNGKYVPYRVGAREGENEGGRVFDDEHTCNMVVELMHIAYSHGLRDFHHRVLEAADEIQWELNSLNRG